MLLSSPTTTPTTTIVLTEDGEIKKALTRQVLRSKIILY